MPQPVISDPADAAVTALVERAAELADAANRDGVDAGADQLIHAAAGNRAALEEARNVYARRLHASSADWTATGALRLLNRALTRFGWIDPYEWKHRRKP